jgi:hypothetical protein
MRRQWTGFMELALRERVVKIFEAEHIVPPIVSLGNSTYWIADCNITR